MGSQEPLSGVEQGMTPRWNNPWTIHQRRWPARVSQTRMARTGGRDVTGHGLGAQGTGGRAQQGERFDRAAPDVFVGLTRRAGASPGRGRPHPGRAAPAQRLPPRARLARAAPFLLGLGIAPRDRPALALADRQPGGPPGPSPLGGMPRLVPHPPAHGRPDPRQALPAHRPLQRAQRPGSGPVLPVVQRPLCRGSHSPLWPPLALPTPFHGQVRRDPLVTQRYMLSEAG